MADMEEMSPASDTNEERGLYVPRGQLAAGNLTVEAQLIETGETPEGTTCAVCQEAPVTHRTGCGHYIHDRCLEPWLRRSNKCPVCRAALPLTCHARWTHGKPVEGEVAELPAYLSQAPGRRLFLHIGRDDSSDETESDDSDGSDIGGAISAALARALAGDGAQETSESGAAPAEDEGDEEEESMWTDSHNHITIHAQGRARVSISIGSENR